MAKIHRPDPQEQEELRRKADAAIRRMRELLKKPIYPA